MKIEIAKPDERMAPSGSAILRSLQNESLPVVDLVVRESIQNSLDAALKDRKFVNFSVTTANVKTADAAENFEMVRNSLTARLPEETTVLALADSNTTGLTGEFNTSDPKLLSESNLYKLIYGINMNQEKGDAGGSWGLGKSSFFRIGAGIVVYYSRIRIGEGGFEERLAACLIEDASKPDAIMPAHPRGIAWWGVKKDGTDEFEKSYPITNQEKIHKILGALKVRPYTEEVTGTTIIIPFINEEEIVFKGSENTMEEDVYWWETNLDDSIKMAIKRWYTPRLMNESYSEKTGQPFLNCQVNGEQVVLISSDWTPKLISQLYNSALTGKSTAESIAVREIKLQRMALQNNNEHVGRVAYTKVSPEEIGMREGVAASPLAVIGQKTDNGKGGSKIMAYARKPGMIVEYAVNDSEWMSGLTVEDNMFVFAFFVPNSDAVLHNSFKEWHQTLENYLRDTEGADHAKWVDKLLGKYQVSIIKRTMREVSKALADDLGESIEAASNRRTSTLSRRFGQIFLPPVNFGQSGRKPPETPPTLAKGRFSAGLSVFSSKLLKDETVLVNCEVKIPKSSIYDINLGIATTDKRLDEERWKKTFGVEKEFPFEIVAAELVEEDNEVNMLFKDQFRDISATSLQLINTEEKNYTLNCNLEIKVSDKSVEPILTIARKE